MTSSRDISLVSVGALLMVALVAACPIEYTVAPAGESGGSECADGELLCGQACVDPEIDPDHCGGCGQACPGDEACVDAQCSSVCPGSLTVCDQTCVDLASDIDHCGECGDDCEGGKNCVASECRDACGDACDEHREICQDEACVCRPGFMRCGGICVDVETDNLHCGRCDNPCGQDPCGAGECQSPGCPGFPDECGDSCTDTQSDVLNCGECSERCESEEDCVQGECDDE